MKRKFFVITSLCILLSNSASAASFNGDFEANPIVIIKSDGKELKVEDVPAIIYKDRTMVPIYLLRQLGADVTWSSESYSVNVTFPNQAVSPIEDLEIKERLLLKNTYQILGDLDHSMWLFVDKLQYYANVDNPSDYLPHLKTDYQKISNQYNETIQFALKVFQTVESNQLDAIMKSEANAMKELTQCKDMLIFVISNKNSLTSNFKVNLLNCLRTIQQNIDNTKKIHHDLLLKEIDIDVNN